MNMDPRRYAQIQRMLGNPNRRLNYNQLYRMWGYPTARLPYHQLNRMLYNPAIKYPYYLIPQMVKQQKAQQHTQPSAQQLPYDKFHKKQPQTQDQPFNKFQQKMDTYAKKVQESEQQKIQAQQGIHDQQSQSSSSSQGGTQQTGSSQGQTPKKKKKSKKSEAMITFDKLSVGTISSSSGVFNGKNIQFGWSSHSKTNTGFGTLGGHNNRVIRNMNVVFDNDQVDTPIDDRDTMWSPVPSA